MIEFLEGLFDSRFMPHGHCYLWRPEILWLHAISDSAIAFAYYTIPFFLIYFVRKRQDLAFPWIFVMFGAFILLCGTTHVMEVWSIWNGTYRLSGIIKAATGIVSVATTFALLPVLPRALSLASPEQLRAANDALHLEITAREQAENRTRELNRELERRIAERTAELERVNADLRMQIAEREQAEKALLELNQKLEHLVSARTEELTQANATLEKRNQELQDFAYVASHDLQEPLRKISTFAQLLEEEHLTKLDESGRMYLDRITDASSRMSRLIRDLLEYSRVSTRTASFQEIDLNSIVAGVLSDLEVRIQEVQGHVTVEALPTLEADPTQMRQLFQNLIGNALKFHRKGIPPVVRLYATPHESDRGRKSFQIAVEDNGIGFEEKYTDQIFAPFKRLHSRGEYAGTGVGLAICKRIVERHGGSITARSTPGEGTTFIIVLPAVQS